MTNITHSITLSTVDNTTAKSKNSKKIVKVWEMGTICTNKKGVTHSTPLHTFQHPHHNTYYSMTKVLCELPLPKVKLTIAFFNDDAILMQKASLDLVVVKVKADYCFTL